MLPFPFVEKSLYAFVNEVGKQAAPTFARSFLCSVALCRAISWELNQRLWFWSLRGSLVRRQSSSARNGSCVQKPPLTVAQVKILEDIVCGKLNRKLPDRVAAGFFMWLIAARARFSDGQNSGILTLDTCIDSGWGSQDTQRANVGEDKELYDFGAEDKIPPPWQGRSECSARDPWAFSLHAGDQGFLGFQWDLTGPLLPSPSETGWGSLPISAEAATSWLKSLLTIGGCSADEVKKPGHTLVQSDRTFLVCKSRPQQGGESYPWVPLTQGVSDGVWAATIKPKPLRQLDGIFRKIAMDEFFPDATRSGYLVKKDGDDNPVEDDSSSSTSSEDSMDEEKS